MSQERWNPARELEKFAVAVVQLWVGELGTVTNTGEGPGRDFLIYYKDGRLGVGEVKWHADETIQAMWGEVFRREHPQMTELKPGSGQWAAHLVPAARIKRLYQELPGLVDRFLEAGIQGMDVFGGWPRGALPDEMRRLGLDRLSQVSTEEPSRAYLAMPGSGGVVPTDPNLIADWMDSMLTEPRYAAKIDYLTAVEADERHVFLMTGSATDFGQEQVLMRLTESDLPSRDPEVPSRVSHIWGIAQFGSARAVLWKRGEGWTTVPVPPPASRAPGR